MSEPVDIKIQRTKCKCGSENLLSKRLHQEGVNRGIISPEEESTGFLIRTLQASPKKMVLGTFKALHSYGQLEACLDCGEAWLTNLHVEDAWMNADGSPAQMPNPSQMRGQKFGS